MSYTKLTPKKLQRMIAEEKKKLKAKGLISNKAEEVDADGYANSLVNQINYIKKLGIKEQKLIGEIKKIRQIRSLLKKKLISKAW